MDIKLNIPSIVHAIIRATSSYGRGRSSIVLVNASVFGHLRVSLCTGALTTVVDGKLPQTFCYRFELPPPRNSRREALAGKNMSVRGLSVRKLPLLLRLPTGKSQLHKLRERIC